MKNNLRQKILNELKFLLNEQEEAEEGVLSGQFSEDLDDILEDINDANIKNIAGFDYIDLTTMEDSTDEGELNLLVKSFKNVTKLSQLQDPDTQKAINKICRTNMLLINSFGPTDTYFYVSCKQTSDSKLRVPVSAKKIGSQGQEVTFQATIEQIQQGSTPTPPSTGNETGNFCADPANNGKPVPDLINFVCKDGQAVTTAPGTTPAPDAGQSKTDKGNIQCTDPQAIVIYQQWLKYVYNKNVSVDGSYGPLTHAAAAAVLGEGGAFEQIKADPQRVCKYALENKAKWSAEIKAKNPKVVPGQKEAGGGGGKSKGSPTTKNKVMFDQMSENTKELIKKFHPNIGAVDFAYKNPSKWVLNIPNNTGTADDQGVLVAQTELYNSIQQDANKDVQILQQRLEENYYDNKKLVEAKQLFNKLLKNL